VWSELGKRVTARLSMIGWRALIRERLRVLGKRVKGRRWEDEPPSVGNSKRVMKRRSWEERRSVVVGAGIDCV
jgi:hypothetical protein